MFVKRKINKKRVFDQSKNKHDPANWFDWLHPSPLPFFGYFQMYAHNIIFCCSVVSSVAIILVLFCVGILYFKF